jgi:peptide/nickel transport system permease protein
MKRLVYCVVLLLFVLVLNYLIFMIMPGDPVTMFIHPYKRGNATEVADAERRLRELWGIGDEPVVRFLKYTVNMFTWNFGITFAGRESVAQEMLWRIPYTLMLLGGSTALAIIIGVTVGAVAAHKRGGKFDAMSVTTSLIFYSLPTFWMGLLFILVFYSNLHWLPHAHAFPAEWTIYPPHPFNTTTSSFNSLGVNIAVNFGDFLTTIGGYVRHAFLPVLTLTLFQYGGYLLLARATLIEALTEDYIVTARAKGVPESSIVLKHALKNASLPLITNVALAFGFMLSGAIITEGVFSWPGMGRWIFDAVGTKDFNVLQAVFYVIALCVILANFIADLLYGIIDPRIKY